MSRSSAVIARRRTLAVALLGVVVGFILLATVVIGGGAEPPATGAAAVVPGSALAYVHVSTDRDRVELQHALRLAKRFPDFPLLSAAVQARAGFTGLGANLSPQLGREAAVAELEAGPLTILDIRNRRAARAALMKAGAAPAGEYRATQILRSTGGREVAFVKHYLVSGQDAAVRQGIDAARSPNTSLQANRTYGRAAQGEPADRVLDAYASAQGVRRLLQGRSGLAGAAAALFDQSTLVAVSASLSPTGHGFKARVHTTFDAGITGLSRGAPSSFTPTLQRVIPRGSSLLLDLTGLQHAAPQLLGAGTAAHVGATIGPLLSRLGDALTAEGVNVPQVLSIFRGEVAIAVSPAAAGTPSLLVAARTSNEEQARETLAMLEPPLAHLFMNTATQAGQAPLLGDVQVGADTVHQLALAPGLQVDYTVSHGLVLIGTSLQAVSGVLQRVRGIADGKTYRTVLPSHPGKVTSLLFLDFTQLLNLVEQAGLTQGARFTTLRPDLQMVRAVGLQSTRGESDSTAELFLQIS